MKRKSLILAGALAQKPNQGGHMWVFLQYLLGFRLLGWDVLLFDRLDTNLCRDREGNLSSPEDSIQVSCLLETMRQQGLQESLCLLMDNGRDSIGLPFAQLEKVVRECDVLLNFNGFLRDDRILSLAACKVFVDIDPGFTQFWHELNLSAIPADHDFYATVGWNVGQSNCTIPKAGREWIPLPPPVILNQWPKVESWSRPFTLLCSWRGAYGTVDFQGRTYGQRPREFRKFVRLPRLSGQNFQLACCIDEAESNDLSLLRENGWNIVDPEAVSSTPHMYRRFIQESMAEFEVAKNLYVESRSGWFSDRAACYLACGKPAIVQDTGLSGHLPTGVSLLTYSTLEEALQCVQKVVSDYELHSSRAREIASEHFDSSKVLLRLLQIIGID